MRSPLLSCSVAHGSQLPLIHSLRQSPYDSCLGVPSAHLTRVPDECSISSECEQTGSGSSMSPSDHLLLFRLSM